MCVARSNAYNYFACLLIYLIYLHTCHNNHYDEQHVRVHGYAHLADMVAASRSSSLGSNATSTPSPEAAVVCTDGRGRKRKKEEGRGESYNVQFNHSYLLSSTGSTSSL